MIKLGNLIVILCGALLIGFVSALCHSVGGVLIYEAVYIGSLIFYKKFSRETIIFTTVEAARWEEKLRQKEEEHQPENIEED